jgi:hypothetical protein
MLYIFFYAKRVHLHLLYHYKKFIKFEGDLGTILDKEGGRKFSMVIVHLG